MDIQREMRAVLQERQIQTKKYRQKTPVMVMERHNQVPYDLLQTTFATIQEFIEGDPERLLWAQRPTAAFFSKYGRSVPGMHTEEPAAKAGFLQFTIRPTHENVVITGVACPSWNRESLLYSGPLNHNAIQTAIHQAMLEWYSLVI